jgi:hypothetical protein
MAFLIRNAYTGETLTQAPSLQAARNYCQQRLLRSAAEDRTQLLSGIAAGVISVFDARNGNYNGPGF